MKKILIVIGVLVSLVLIGGYVAFSNAKRLPDLQKVRIQSAYKISNALLTGKIKPEDVLSENRWYLLNNDYMDKYAYLYHFEFNEKSWKCAIGLCILIMGRE